MRPSSILQHANQSSIGHFQDTNTISGAVQPSARGLKRSYNDDDLCPITREPLNTYALEDIYETRQGVAYFRPALKLWLHKYDRLPLHERDAKQVIENIWPGATATSARREQREAWSLRIAMGSYCMCATTVIVKLGVDIGFNLKESNDMEGFGWFAVTEVALIAICAAALLVNNSVRKQQLKSRQSDRPMTANDWLKLSK